MPTYLGIIQIYTQSTYGLSLGMTLWTYDWLLTIEQEIQYIWSSKWTPGKVLFLTVRYGGLLTIVIYLYDVTEQTCQVTLYWALCSQVCVVGAASTILALRTWAIWNRSRVVAVILLVAWLVQAGSSLRWLVMAIEDVTFANLGLGLRGCNATNTQSSSAAALRIYITLGSYEGLIFLMTVLRGTPYLYKGPKLAVTLYRDAFMASTCLLTLAICNSILSNSGLPSYYLTYFISLACSSVLPARIILNIRAATLELDAWDVTTAKPTVNSAVSSDLSEHGRAEYEFEDV